MANTKYSYDEKRKGWSTLVYDGTLTATGAKHRVRITSKKSSADLEKKVMAFKQQVAEGGASKVSNITFGEYAEQWFETSKSTRELNTQRTYRVILDSCFQEIWYIPLNQLTYSHFQICVNAKKEHPRTCQLLSMTFTQIIKAAVRDRYLPRSAVLDITEGVSLPKYQKPIKRPLTELEKEALSMANLEPMKRAFVSILYYCGLRKGEALALTPSDFNWESKEVSITKAWASDQIKPYPKSNNGVRNVPIPDAAIPLIRPYVESKDGYIFHGRTSEIMKETAYRRMWESIVYQMNEALGYNPYKNHKSEKQIKGLTAHTFRHNYCTELCYQIPTISTKMIARLLGDNEKMVIEVYSHLVEDKEKPADAVNNIFNL